MGGIENSNMFIPVLLKACVAVCASVYIQTCILTQYINLNAFLCTQNLLFMAAVYS